MEDYKLENSVYLIDYENVSYKGLYGISEVKPEDEIIIFYSNDVSIIQDIISAYVKQGIMIKYFELDKTGKNALDFMVSAYAGYAASKQGIKRIAVLSNDKGYLSIESIIKTVNSDIELVFDNCIHNVIHPEDKKDVVPVSSVQTIEKTESVKSEVNEVKKTAPKAVTKEEVKKHLQSAGIPAKYIPQLVSIIVNGVSKNISESEFATAVNKSLGSKKANTPFKNSAKSYFKKLLGK